MRRFTRPTANNQAGFVSLFTVIFFILMMTVVTVGFLRVMALEQQQALNNDLTASANAAAESGIEDGKRALLAYYTSPDANLRTALGNAFNSDACDSLTSSAVIRNALKFDAAGNAIGNNALNQYYTCLTVKLNSPNYMNHQPAGKSDFIPLNTANNASFNRIKISWHLISPTVGADGDGIPANYPPGPLLPPVNNVNGNPSNSWSTQGYPAYLRTQLYGYPTNQPLFNKFDIEDRSRTLFLVPSANSNAAATDANTPINFATNDPHGFTVNKTILKQIKCVPNPGTSVGAYACTALLELPTAFPSTGTKYFLRVTPIYGQSHFQFTLQQDGADIELSGVQPIVDATGRAADVFRRQQARLRVNSIGDLPEYVVESADTICKNLIVTDGSFYQPNNCP